MGKKGKNDTEHEHVGPEEAVSPVIDSVVSRAIDLVQKKTAARRSDLSKIRAKRYKEKKHWEETRKAAQKSMEQVRKTLEKHEQQKREKEMFEQERTKQETFETHRAKRQREFFRYTRDHAFSHAPDKNMQMFGYDPTVLPNNQPTYMDMAKKDTLLAPRRSHSRSGWKDPDPGCTYASKVFTELKPLSSLKAEKYEQLILARRKANEEVNDELSDEQILSSMTGNERSILTKVMKKIQGAFDLHGGVQNAEMRG